MGWEREQGRSSKNKTLQDGTMSGKVQLVKLKTSSSARRKWLFKNSPFPGTEMAVRWGQQRSKEWREGRGEETLSNWKYKACPHSSLISHPAHTAWDTSCISLAGQGAKETIQFSLLRDLRRRTQVPITVLDVQLWKESSGGRGNQFREGVVSSRSSALLSTSSYTLCTSFYIFAFHMISHHKDSIHILHKHSQWFFLHIYTWNKHF